MMSHVLHMTEPSFKLSTVLQLRTYVANNYINTTYFICSLATWGKYKGNIRSINLLLPFKNLITLHTLYRISCQDLFIIICI